MSDETKKLVEDELRETDETRQHAIQALREWAMQNPRIIKMRLDSKFLLRFLRPRKFSIPMAQEVIERCLVLRLYRHNETFAFSRLDVKQQAIQDLLDLG